MDHGGEGAQISKAAPRLTGLTSIEVRGFTSIPGPAQVPYAEANEFAHCYEVSTPMHVASPRRFALQHTRPPQRSHRRSRGRALAAVLGEEFIHALSRRSSAGLALRGYGLPLCRSSRGEPIFFVMALVRDKLAAHSFAAYQA